MEAAISASNQIPSSDAIFPSYLISLQPTTRTPGRTRGVLENVTSVFFFSSLPSPSYILSLSDGGFNSSSCVNFHPRFSQPASERFPIMVMIARSFPFAVSFSASPPVAIVSL